MKRIMFLSAVLFLITGCHFVADKAKKTINKAGEVVAVGTSEFAKGVGNGIDKNRPYNYDTASLNTAGISLQRVIIGADSNRASDNKLSCYFVFKNAIDGDIAVMLNDKNGFEYGRTTTHVKAAAGSGQYVDFIFDKRTDITGESKMSFSVKK